VRSAGRTGDQRLERGPRLGVHRIVGERLAQRPLDRHARRAVGNALVARMARREGAGRDDVVAIARAVGVALEGEAAPGRDVGPGGERPVALAARDDLLAAQLALVVRITAREVAAREFEGLELRELVLVGRAARGLQLLLDRLEVAVLRGVGAGVELPRAHPARDLVMARLGGVARHVAQGALHGQLVVRDVARVRQVHGAGRIVRVEPVVDAFVFQEAR
jgi:hypothetical protein